VGLNNDSTTFAGAISGTAGLKKQGTNTITLSGSSSHSGATVVAQGTLALNPVSSFSGSSSLVVSNGATLALIITNGGGVSTSASISLNGGTNLTVEYGNAGSTGGTTPITTSGALNLNGVSQIGIAGNGFGVGDYTLISYGSKTGGGSISSTLAYKPVGMEATISDTGSAIVMHVTVPSVQVLAYTYGDGGVWATNAASVYWNLGGAAYAEYSSGFGDAVTFGTSYGGYTLSGGTVSVSTDVHPYSILASGSYTLTGPGKITGATGIQMAGAGSATFVLDNTNSYTGVTTVGSGTLQINNGSALGSTAGGTVVASGGSLALSNSMTLSGEPITLNGSGTAGNNGALRLIDTNAITVAVASPITLGSTARIVGGSLGSQLSLSGPITDNGSNYTLFVNNPSGGSLMLNSAGNLVGNLTVYGTNIGFGVANTFPSSTLSVGTGVFDLNGTAQVFAGLLAGYVPAGGVLTNSSASPSTLTINGTNYASFQSVLAGLVNVVKAGSSVQSFAGGSTIKHTYSGTTTINEGTLGIASDMSGVTNSFIVNNGGELRGSATTIGGPVTVNPGGTFYAAFATNAIGDLTISNNLSLAGNTIVKVNKSVSPSNDVINVTGALHYGGTLTVYDIGTNVTPFVVGDTFKVFPTGGVGYFTNGIVGPAGVTFGFADGVLTVTSVGTSTPPTLNYASLTGGVLHFDWTGAFKLQWQTNSLGTNWVDYPDASNPVNVTNNPALPAAFFRLKSL
jgi:autotransporter-associated beta strand protein